MRENNRSLGTKYEKLAGEYLENKGYQILEYNYRCRMGEIDIIALDGEYIVFVEVKYRKSLAQGYPCEAVTRKKQQTILKVAMVYMNQHGYGVHTPMRFDVVGIQGQEIMHIRNAFQG